MKHSATIFMSAAIVLVLIDVATANFGGGKGKYCEQATSPQQPTVIPTAVFNPLTKHLFCPTVNVPWTNARCVADTTHPAFFCNLVPTMLPSKIFNYVVEGDDTNPFCQPPATGQSADSVSTRVLVCAPDSVGPDGK